MLLLMFSGATLISLGFLMGEGLIAPSCYLVGEKVGRSDRAGYRLPPLEHARKVNHH